MIDTIQLTIDGQGIKVPPGTIVAAAIAMAMPAAITRRSVGGALRGPVCGMGVCQECRVTIDGVAHQLSCQTPCAPGMDVRTALSEGAP
ncbi:2Fe-2S iron-sulfur cluster-binding protein [Pseudoduganella namucuonensis]|uniref:2Fe-2S iron-sulfur cluster binding domain-containing protein n=1 Tax=Pseudoduganella namucuonensis TaxID=1035707 RepID=A0A1I7K623_9BURK|nr:2Fe-2S iron-sulfur cluster-binding protein [Pseudoduganella namucuonensis]SFU92854.1 2Fe-2S iron-sulfur cluster binding domain-containing protein [Pseudoduganella namucuonensis]